MHANKHKNTHFGTWVVAIRGLKRTISNSRAAQYATSGPIKGKYYCNNENIKSQRKQSKRKWVLACTFVCVCVR